METFNAGMHTNKWIEDGTLAATGSFRAPEASHYGSAVFTWQWLGTSTPNGTFKLEGNNQTGASGETWYPLYIDANKAYGVVNNAAYTHTGGATISVNHATAGYLMVILDKLPPWIRLVWTSSSGGAAAALQGQAHYRPV